jgi:uncharacterized protein GlcG (DUF336 family)
MRARPISRAPLASMVMLGLLALLAAPHARTQALTVEDVTRVITQAATSAQRDGLAGHVAVVDADGNLLGLFSMNNAPAQSIVPGTLGQGLEGLALPAQLVARTKAATGAFLSSGGNAFSTRSASFIVQEHFPPGIDDTPGGPLFGVQFSSLVCTDIKQPSAILGLSADPGGLPLYKNGRVVGGVGVEGDGRYGIDLDPSDSDQPAEERAATAGQAGFAPADLIRGENILADGIRIPYDNSPATTVTGSPAGTYVSAPRAGSPSNLVPGTLGGLSVRLDPRFQIRAGSALSATEVTTILSQAIRQAAHTRAAIRQPLGSDARVSYAVVDVDGSVLGFAQNDDAPNFGVDVSVQKARTAAFFSGAGAGDDLRRAGLVIYTQSGVPLDGSVAITSRAVGFLAQPFFPPGIGGTDPGPFSLPIRNGEWSPFNTGLQLDLVQNALRSALAGVVVPCNLTIPRLANGITIFPGGIPLYKSGRLVGAIGVSGDGVDQDDLIASSGAAGFDAPPEKRSDQLTIRGVRLPYVKFPRHPEL